jgi:ribosomal protein L11 methylase PrmA
MTRIAEIVVEVAAARRAGAERAAWAAGAQGIETRDQDHGVPRGRVQVVWWAPSPLAKPIAAKVRAELGPDARVATRSVDASWLPAARPRKLGAGFVVVGPDDRRPDVRGRRALALDANLGFGDGLHPTTRLCVEALERVSMPARVLDVGTGTGVLSLVAAHLGAERLTATDIDPLALHAARANLRRNGVRVRLRSELPSGRFGLVVANLYLEPLLRLLPQLCARADTVIVSGFGVASAAHVRARFEALDFAVERKTTRARFACVTATRRPTTHGARARRRA